MDTKDLENVKPDAVIDEIVENEGENARKDAPINGEDEAFKGGEKLEDRVKLLSPGRLVLKRFFRSKLSVIGLAVLIAFSLFRSSDRYFVSAVRSYGDRTK